MEYLQRNLYLDQLKALNNTPDIKVITGIRRCGKSILLDEYAAYLRTAEPECNIVKINLQELEYEELLEYRKLHAHLIFWFCTEQNDFNSLAGIPWRDTGIGLCVRNTYMYAA